MSYYHFDRLSALDAMFLQIEDPNVHMHVAAIALFEMGPLANPNGTLAFERILQKIESALGLSPRFKQKLAQVPLTGDPVWVDDPRFNLSYHVRHTSLPRPGSTRTLKRLAGRILSQKLDRNKSLWEMWVVEGVEDGRFAIIAKAHHCMVDGISGFDLFTGMLRLDPDPTVEPIPKSLSLYAKDRGSETCRTSVNFIRRRSWSSRLFRAESVTTKSSRTSETSTRALNWNRGITSSWICAMSTCRECPPTA